MAKTPRSLSTARANLEASLSIVEGRYRSGVEGADWLGPTVSQQAEDNYRTGVDEAISADRRRVGARRAGEQGYKDGALDKGVRNIVPGIRANLGKYEENSRASHDRMVAAQQRLPAKTRDFQANITNRLIPIVRALKGE